MSIRAGILRFVLRHTMKKLFNNVGETQSGVDSFRIKIKFTEKFSRPLAKNISIQATKINGVKCEWISTANDNENNEEQKVLVYLHGGGYVIGGPDSHRDIAWRIAEKCSCKLLLVDYRLAPEHQFPAAIDDATNCYQGLLDSGFQSKNIAFAGDSAGGGLTAATLLNLKHHELPQPKCAVLMSPWLDLSAEGPSIPVNESADPMLTLKALNTMAKHYLGEQDSKTPLASPIFADLSGLAPILVHVGSTEILLSDSERFCSSIRDCQGEVSLVVWPKMPHVFQMFASFIPEAKQSISQISAFISLQLKA